MGNDYNVDKDHPKTVPRRVVTWTYEFATFDPIPPPRGFMRSGWQRYEPDELPSQLLS